MKQSIRRHGPALFVVIVAAVVAAACGQVTTSEEARPAGGLRAAQPSTARLVQADVCIDGEPCAPTGAHGKHQGYACTTCHRVGGRLAFDPAGPAYGTGTPSPSFDATAKTCSNVACHGVPAGTYSYWFPGNEDTDGDGYPDSEYKTVAYGGTMAATTPSWYSTGAACAACHGNPPANGSTGSNAWHSGSHANDQNFSVGGGLVLNANQCELCHNDLVGSVFSPIAASVPDGVGGYVGTSILLPTFHGNGLNVAPRWRSTCFGCH